MTGSALLRFETRQKMIKQSINITKLVKIVNKNKKINNLIKNI